MPPLHDRHVRHQPEQFRPLSEYGFSGSMPEESPPLKARGAQSKASPNLFSGLKLDAKKPGADPLS
ncbi:MAG: hypothetical protein CVU60_08340 [Deltaproteobacteria bacterium HGW-Deltaproteobacteria-18]|nr:MAG: hypothetical protein CVU60_08340 [Deltaproteobacteria bacterium HGW-Deltaproteobacteria-18]